MKKITTLFAFVLAFLAVGNRVYAQTPCTNTDCYMVFNMSDSYGDGWNGGTIVVSQNGQTLASITLLSGNSGVDTVRVCTSNGYVTLSWTTGSYDSETAFTITDSANNTLYSGSGNGMSGTFATLDPCYSCAPPSNLTSTAVTSSAISISWTGGTATSWNVACSPYNAVPADGWTEVTSTTHTFTELASNTDYYVFVRSVCGPEDTSSYTMATIRTECGPTADLPINEHFANNGGNAPQCWDIFETAYYDYGYGYGVTYPQFYTYGGHEGDNGHMQLYATTTEGSGVRTPKMPVLANQIEVLLWTSGEDGIEVGYVTSPDSGAVFHLVGTTAPTQYENYSYSWEQFHISFDTVTTSDSIYVVIRRPIGLAQDAVGVDDVLIRQIIDCPLADNLTVVETTPQSGTVQLAWTGGDNTSWQVAYGPTGMVVDTATNFLPTNTNSITVTGLDDLTMYDFYVRSNCGPVVGYWRGPLTTQPNVRVLTNAVDTVTSCGVNIVDNGGLFGNYSEGTQQTIVLYPSEEHSAIRIRGNLALGGYNNYDNATFRVFAGADTTGMLIASYANGSYYNIDLTSEVGPMTIVFSGAYDYYYVSGGYNLYVSCEELSNCTTPYGLAVTEAGMNTIVTWQYDTSLGEAEGFTLWYEAAGGESNSVELPGSARSYTLSGLQERTNYTVRLAVSCEGIDTISTTYAMGCLVGGEVIVGEGTEQYPYMPAYPYYGNTLSQQLFLNNELEGATAIYGFSIIASGDYAMTRAIDIYMDTTSVTEFNSTNDYIVQSDSNIYFSGNHTFVTGVNEFTFSRPFIVEAGKNVVLTVHDRTNSWQSSLQFNTTSTTDAKAMYTYRDNTPFDPADSNNFTSWSSTIAYYRNSITFLTPCSDSRCVPPTITDAVADTHSVALTWQPGMSETEWSVEYRHVDSTNWIVAAASVTTTSYTLTGLNSGTDYSVRISSLCTDTVVSRKITVATLCGGNALPFFEGFEHNFVAPYSTNDMQRCWARGNNYPNSDYIYPYLYDYSSYEGNFCMYFTYYRDYIVLPKMEAPIDSLMLSFRAMFSYDYYGVPSIEIGVCTDPYDTNTFTVIETLQLGDETYNWYLYETYLDNYTGADGHIFIRSHQNSDTYMYFYVDNILVDRIPACRKVKNAGVDNVTSNSVTLSFTDNYEHTNYTVFYGTGIDSVGYATDSLVITASPFTITGLTANTSYHIWVRGNCGDDHSSYLDYGYINTVCAPIAVTEDQPYFDEFEADAALCAWEKTISGNVHWTITTSTNPRPHSGGYMLNLGSRSNGESMYVLPTFDFSGMTGNAEISFYQYLSSGSDTAATAIYYRTSENGEWTLASTIARNNVNQWRKYYVELPASAGASTYQVALWGSTHGNANGVFVDDIFVKGITNCLIPTDVTLDNVTERTATVHWNGNAASYKVQYRVIGDWNWNARTVTGVDSCVISPLEMMSDYEVRVASVCSAYEQSEYTDILTFTSNFCTDRNERDGFLASQPDTIVAGGFHSPTCYYTYTEIIIDSARLAGLSNINGLVFYPDSINGGVDLTDCKIWMGHTTQGTISSFLYDSTFSMVYEGSLTYNTTNPRKVLLNEFQYQGGNLVVGILTYLPNYYYAVPNYLASHVATTNKVYTGTYNNYNNALTPEIANLLPAGNKSASNIVPDFSFLGCNPVCYEPVVSNVNTTHNSIRVEWYNEQADVEIQIKDAAATVWDNAILISDDNSYTYEALNPVSTFDIRLRRVCGEGEYSDYVVLQVHTDTMCSMPTALTVSNITGTSATFAWTDGNITGTKWQLHVWNDDMDIYRDVTTNPATIDGLVSGLFYQAEVSAYCGSNNHVQGDFSDPISFNNICSPVTNVNAVYSNGDVNITWTPGERNQQWIVLYGYAGFAFNEHLGYITVNTPNATLNGFTAAAPYSNNFKGTEGDNYGFRVRALCGDDWNSPWSNEVTVHIESEGIEDVENARFGVSPNPASDVVTLSLEGIEGTANVSILSIDGRLVESFEATAEKMEINVSSYATGSYFVRVQSAGWTAVRKLNVVR